MQLLWIIIVIVIEYSIGLLALIKNRNPLNQEKHPDQNTEQNTNKKNTDTDTDTDKINNNFNLNFNKDKQQKQQQQQKTIKKIN